MTSNHDPAKVTMFHITLEHTLDHFLEFWIFRGETLFWPVEPTPYSSTNPDKDMIKKVIEVTEFNSRVKCELRGCLEAAIASEATREGCYRQHAYQLKGS